MPGPFAKRSKQLWVGASIAVVFVVVALVCLYVTSRPQYLMTSAPVRTRNLGLISYGVVSVSLLVVGLVARRWWQATLAPIALCVGAVWWSTWIMNLPKHIAESDWSLKHALHVANVLGTTWHVVATLVVVVGWGLVRRDGWWWGFGLLPSGAVIALAEVIEHASKPGRYDGSGHGAQAAFRWLSHSLQVQGTVTILLSTLTVVGCVWLCVLAERRLPAESGRGERQEASLLD
jgi:hypothetical protein